MMIFSNTIPEQFYRSCSGQKFFLWYPYLQLFVLSKPKPLNDMVSVDRHFPLLEGVQAVRLQFCEIRLPEEPLIQRAALETRLPPLKSRNPLSRAALRGGVV